MKKLFPLIIALFGAMNVTVAQVKWAVDPAHTNVRFTVEHLGISFVDGEFNSFEGSVDAPTKTGFENAKVDFKINVNSIDTRIEARDKHLKSDDFFNAEKYPAITLKSVSLKKDKAGKLKLEADLTIRDVTKRVIFDVKQNGQNITDPWGKTRAGFTATTKINRLDYGIKYNDKLPSGVAAVGSDVTITVNTELVQQ
ncbi:YceI family protein [Sphingobacterium spiritivorum]|uniref:YceI family protein n=1 Tax=Sphingobacterium spiritivorum TaxID=258 RepID=UPI003DA1ED6C